MPLQGRNKERLLNALFSKSLAFGKAFLLANSSARYAIKKPVQRTGSKRLKGQSSIA